MPISRIFQPIPFVSGTIFILDSQATHHVARVLRAQPGDLLTLFNGLGGEYEAIITRIDKKNITVQIEKFIPREAESPLTLHLAQGISRGEKMDYTIQKAVELGIDKITPLITERCTVRLDEERRQKRLQHWQAIIVSACEQSGRNTLPEITIPQSFTAWLPSVTADLCLALSPHAQTKLATLSLKKPTHIVLLIGPEGGLSEAEIHLACQHHFLSLSLGPRILRTETAAVAAITSLQCRFGDI